LNHGFIAVGQIHHYTIIINSVLRLGGSHFLRRFNFFEVNKRKGNSQPLKEEEKKQKLQTK
jgi:hypothetical protein